MRSIKSASSVGLAINPGPTRKAFAARCAIRTDGKEGGLSAVVATRCSWNWSSARIASGEGDRFDGDHDAGDVRAEADH
jgi:hypothetical protein